MNKQSIAGIIPAVTIAYDDQGRVCPDRLEALYDFQIRGGVNGLFVGGSTGEWPLLKSEERKLAARVALDTAAGRVPVLMHISSMLPDEVIDYGHWAQENGIAAVSVIMPSYYTYDQQGLMSYFDAILPHLELPVYLYNIPVNVKNVLTPALFRALCEKYPVVAGVKDSSMDFLRLQEYATVGKNYFTGNDAQMLLCLMWGGNGAISAAAGAFPETVSQLYNCFKEGDLIQARKIQDRLMAYREFVVTHPALSVVKEALEYRGFATGGLRPPLHMLCEDHKKQLHELIEKLELVP